jgi:hypothetical protein
LMSTLVLSSKSCWLFWLTKLLGSFMAFDKTMWYGIWNRSSVLHNHTFNICNHIHVSLHEKIIAVNLSGKEYLISVFMMILMLMLQLHWNYINVLDNLMLIQGSMMIWMTYKMMKQLIIRLSLSSCSHFLQTR